MVTSKSRLSPPRRRAEILLHNAAAESWDLRGHERELVQEKVALGVKIKADSQASQAGQCVAFSFYFSMLWHRSSRGPVK